MVHLYDSMQRAVVPFEPANAPTVTMYVCGPTVYDVAHLGHGRTALVFDTIRRCLTWRGYTVNYVSNVTDIDDKIIARASESRRKEAKLAKHFSDAYWKTMDSLGVQRPTNTPYATKYIPQMIAYIQRLIDDGAAYVVPGRGVYFSVARYPGYGDLVGRTAEALRDNAEARIDADDAKADPLDFALWKDAKPGEPTWKSPWGEGRPGWHIECTAMSIDLLGPGFDIHGGGSDLLFPHHENERAQAEAAGDPFARYWMHSGMVEVAGEKMSKSTGNFSSLDDLLGAHDPRAVRLLVLQSHYRSQMEMGPDELHAADRSFERFVNMVRRVSAHVEIPRLDVGVGSKHSGASGELVSTVTAAVDDDFDTPAALAAIFEAATVVNQLVDAGDYSSAAELAGTIIALLKVLGVEVTLGNKHRVDDALIDAMVAERNRARARRDFDEADILREELAEMGVIVEDTADGSTWYR
ncbi:MAG: cysteine--tRNA ligase [Actinobacteria bacterium]|nr:cysteine--tRNA ligase [Actinomycetota bacterium]MCB9389737.1 cysteine--tRNA ligase [Acidimicrobiia bacterium]